MSVAAKSPVLAVESLRVERGATTVLAGVTWCVQRGENWVILGPNGSGKTSLLTALTAYLTPTSGTIDLLGRRYGRCDWRELRRSVGLVSSALSRSIPAQEEALQTVISGRYAMLDFWGDPTASDLRRARDILRRIGAESLAGRRWEVLSQGERQRVLIGRALMADPLLLVLDEPCAGLDPVAREQFLGFLEQWKARKGAPSLILVTHHVEEIVSAFSHVLLLAEGRVVAQGRREEVLNSRELSAAFGVPVQLRRSADRFTLKIKASRPASEPNPGQRIRII